MEQELSSGLSEGQIAGGCQSAVDPLRERTCLQTHALIRTAYHAKQCGDSICLGLDFALSDKLAARVHHANAGGPNGYIETDEQLPSSPPDRLKTDGACPENRPPVTPRSSPNHPIVLFDQETQRAPSREEAPHASSRWVGRQGHPMARGLQFRRASADQQRHAIQRPRRKAGAPANGSLIILP